MRFALEALFLFAGAASLAKAAPAQKAEAPAASPLPSPTPRPSPSPSPAPSGKLLPYWYETDAQRYAGPYLQFQDRAEVRSLEMNMAIERFFQPDENGDTRRGTTLGGGPTLSEMAEHRPGNSPSLNFLGLAAWAARGVKTGFADLKKTRVERNEEALRALLLASAKPSPSATPTPTPPGR